MRRLFTFLFLLLLIPTAALAGVESKIVEGTKRELSFYVSTNPVVVEKKIKYKLTNKVIETPTATAPLETTATAKLKLLLGAVAFFLSLVGLWSAVKNFIVSFVSTQREGFGLKLIGGTVTFIVSLAILLYALNLLAGSF